MRRFTIAIGLFLLLLSGAFAREQSLFARVTVYWANGDGGSDRWAQEHKSANGTRLRAGHCAVDPRRIPYGSKVVFPDGACVAVDTGPDVINRKAARKTGRTPLERSALVIDRFFETKPQALAWAKGNPHFMTLRILEPESIAASSHPQTDISKIEGSKLIAQNDSRSCFP